MSKDVNLAATDVFIILDIFEADENIVTWTQTKKKHQMDHFIYSLIVCRLINFLWWKMIRFYDYERFIWGVLFTTWNEWKGRCRPYTLLLANVLFIIGRPGRDYGNTNDSWLSWIRSVNKVMFIGFLYQSFTDDGVLVANGKWELPLWMTYIKCCFESVAVLKRIFVFVRCWFCFTVCRIS